MNILELDRKQIQDFISRGLMRPENLKHYDICRAMAEGKKQKEIAEEYRLDNRNVRYIKSKKCPECQ